MTKTKNVLQCALIKNSLEYFEDDEYNNGPSSTPEKQELEEALAIINHFLDQAGLNRLFQPDQVKRILIQSYQDARIFLDSKRKYGMQTSYGSQIHSIRVQLSTEPAETNEIIRLDLIDSSGKESTHRFKAEREDDISPMFLSLWILGETIEHLCEGIMTLRNGGIENERELDYLRKLKPHSLALKEIIAWAQEHLPSETSTTLDQIIFCFIIHSKAHLLLKKDSLEGAEHVFGLLRRNLVNLIICERTVLTMDLSKSGTLSKTQLELELSPYDVSVLGYSKKEDSDQTTVLTFENTIKHTPEAILETLNWTLGEVIGLKA